ncbi:MAG: M20/M25/M40 family metallo-hydrolase [Candidatus Hydrothermales bacterium]
MIEGLKRHVEVLSLDIGKRNVFYYKNYLKTKEYILENLRNLNYEIREIKYRSYGYDVFIIEVGKIFSSLEIFIIGAHYDSFYDSPGADDNATGVSLLIEIAKSFSNFNFKKDIRFLFFPNEEPPFFASKGMGSEVYAEILTKRKEKVELMISLESIGYYSDEKNSQKYPFPLNFLYPDTANFIGIVSNLRSRFYMKKLSEIFKNNTSIQVQYLAFPPIIPEMNFSDHYPFWKRGTKALLVTDTAFLRNPNYHTKFDLPETIDYKRLFEVYKGIASFIEFLNSSFTFQKI